MAIYTMGADSVLYVDQYDMTGTVREGSFEAGVESLDVTAWGDDTRVYRAGLKTAQLSIGGYQDFAANTVDPVLSTEIAATNTIITMGADGAAAGDIVYCMDARATSYVPIQGSVGDIAQYGLEASATGNWFRGVVLRTKANTTASSQASGQQLGTIAATKSMYAALHIFSMSGGMTIDVIIESDDNSGFTSATTRMSFAQASAAGAQIIGPTAGPGGSDDYWRVRWTVTGSGTINFATIFSAGSSTSG